MTIKKRRLRLKKNFDIPTVVFRSFDVHWKKERQGLKCNTLRMLNDKDRRYQILMSSMKRGQYGHIEIENSYSGESFERRITDVTQFNNWMIISWEHKEGAEE